MKYKIALFVILFPAFAAAQNNIASTLARAVLDSAMTSTLGIDSISGEVNMREYDQFKNHFDPNAMVIDNFNVYYQFNAVGKAGYYKTDTAMKPFDVYAHDVALQVKNLAIDSLVIVRSDVSNPANMIFFITRKVQVEKAGLYVVGDTKKFLEGRDIRFDPPGDKTKMIELFTGKIRGNNSSVYKFVFTDSVKVSIKYDAAVNTCKITAIENIHRQYNVDDNDNDAVLNSGDSLKNKAGDFTADGMPDYDLDGIPDAIDKCPRVYGTKDNFGCPFSYFTTSVQWEGYVGVQLNAAKINLPELNRLGYADRNGNDAIDVLQSKKGVLKNEGLSPGVYAGANIAYFFGRKRKFGVSLGVMYSKFKSVYQLTSPAVYTYKSFDGNDDYRRQVTIAALDEEILYNIYSIPLMANFRWHVGRSDRKGESFFCVKAGPSLMFFNNTSDHNATIDFGGIYQINPGTNTLTYTDLLDANSTYNVYITSDGINQQNTNPGAVSVFQQLSKHYDFASNKTFSNKNINLSRRVVAFNAAFDFQKELTNEFSFKAGLHYVYAPLASQKERYIPIDKTTDDFNSIFNISDSRNYHAFGGNVGFVYNF